MTSILGGLAQGTRDQARRQSTTMKREKFDTKSKTKRCGAPDCPYPGTTVKFGKERRILCKKHIQLLNARSEEHKVTKSTFKRASDL